MVIGLANMSMIYSLQRRCYVDRMFQEAFIQERGGGKLSQESYMVVDELSRRGVPFTLYTIKKINRRQLPLSLRSLVVGDVDCMHGAMKQLGITIPKVDSYPQAIHHHLHRRVWTSTLGQEAAKFAQGSEKPQFIKPRNQLKRFTGLVVETDKDFFSISSVSFHEPIYCSDIVEFVSEYRVYVVDTKICAIDHYKGNQDIPIDLKVVQDAVTCLSQSNNDLGSYGIDFGVLSTGKTALVEMNEGFALGAYDVAARVYTDLLITRWQKLVASIESRSAT